MIAGAATKASVVTRLAMKAISVLVQKFILMWVKNGDSRQTWKSNW